LRFYKHYKNKPYKFIGIAKHSESLEDLVIYETLYGNQLGSLWARPKEMFFESITLNGIEKKRFRKLDLEIEAFADLEESHIDRISKLAEYIFSDWDFNDFKTKLKSHTGIYLLIAKIENQEVGFKLGYEKDNTTFYSWLGGVLPEFRGLGVASDLMVFQQEGCIKKGYKLIQTKTKNKFKEMLLLNIKSGFQIIGFEEVAGGESKIILEKKV